MIWKLLHWLFGVKTNNMPIALFGKVEQHNHNYYGPVYNNPVIAADDTDTDRTEPITDAVCTEPDQQENA